MLHVANFVLDGMQHFAAVRIDERLAAAAGTNLNRLFDFFKIEAGALYVYRVTTTINIRFFLRQTARPKRADF
jgi:hypothetical protein